MRRLTTTFTIIATINAGNNSYIAKTPPNPDKYDEVRAIEINA